MKTGMPRPGSETKERKTDTAPPSEDQYQATRPIFIHDSDDVEKGDPIPSPLSPRPTAKS